MVGLIQLSNETCGNDLYFLSSAHHGINEERALEEFNPYLDLDEMITFAATSWIKRDREKSNFDNVIDNSNLYELFSWVYNKGGYGMLNKHKNISAETLKIYNKHNTAKGELLKERLGLIPLNIEEQLRKELKQPTFIYCRNEKDYYNQKNRLRGDNSRLEILPFKKVYTTKEEMPYEFSRLIAKEIRSFPTSMGIHYPEYF
jgi:hypothetical protein